MLLLLLLLIIRRRRLPIGIIRKTSTTTDTSSYSWHCSWCTMVVVMMMMIVLLFFDHFWDFVATLFPLLCLLWILLRQLPSSFVCFGSFWIFWGCRLLLLVTFFLSGLTYSLTQSLPSNGACACRCFFFYLLRLTSSSISWIRASEIELCSFFGMQGRFLPSAGYWSDYGWRWRRGFAEKMGGTCDRTLVCMKRLEVP